MRRRRDGGVGGGGGLIGCRKCMRRAVFRTMVLDAERQEIFVITSRAIKN